MLKPKGGIKTTEYPLYGSALLIDLLPLIAGAWYRGEHTSVYRQRDSNRVSDLTAVYSLT